MSDLTNFEIDLTGLNSLFPELTYEAQIGIGIGIAILLLLFVFRNISQSCKDDEDEACENPRSLHFGQAERSGINVEELELPIHEARFSPQEARRINVIFHGHSVKVGEQYDHYYDFDGLTLQEEYFDRIIAHDEPAALAALIAGFSRGYFSKETVHSITGGKANLNHMFDVAGDAIEIDHSQHA